MSKFNQRNYDKSDRHNWKKRNEELINSLWTFFPISWVMPVSLMTFRNEILPESQKWNRIVQRMNETVVN